VGTIPAGKKYINQHIRTMKTVSRITNMSRELKLFVTASLVMGIAFNIVESTFNNFLNERFALTGFQRSFLEFPRELPGFLVVFVSASLWFFCSRRQTAIAMLLCAAGALLIGFLSPVYMIMVAWLFIYSAGQHLVIPLSSTIGMELAKEGKTGQRLGQLNAVRNAATIIGSLLVLVGFKYAGITFHHTFAMAAFGFIAAAVLMFKMKPEQTQRPKEHLKLYKEYRLYYLLSILYGSRKQIFLTFGPWVLVTVFHQPTQTIAGLFLMGAIVGIVFQPLLGMAIDRLGERFVLLSEAALLIFVCLGYGFSKFLLAERTAFIVVCVCFLLDQMLMSVNIARSTYMKKIALHDSHVQPALTSSVTLDHIFSITVGLLGGVIWDGLGFQYVFLLGALVSVCNLFAALYIRIPKYQAI
jgi:predicted MFS family arabinose efflux permease